MSDAISKLKDAKFNSKEELFQAVVDAGKEKLELGTAIISKVNGDEYTVLKVSSPLEINEGDVFDLPGTFCSLVYETMDVVAYNKIGSIESVNEHPCYDALRLEAYISAPIIIDGKPFGTVNFSDKEPRLLDFSDGEVNFMRDLASIVGEFIKTNEA